jgi:hypothetical protein
VSLLGRVQSAVEVDNTKTGSNSTRWVFDVEQDEGSFAFDLIQGGRIYRPILKSPFLAPLAPNFYEARVFFSKLNGSGLEITCSQATKYRVSIDTIASTVR